METKPSKKEKAITRYQYVKLLEEHLEITSRYRTIYLDERLPHIERSIEKYREKFSSMYPKTVLVTTLFFGFISSTAMGTAIIWTINEIIAYPVDFSLKNILVVSSVFFLAKTKLKFFDNS